MHHHAVKSFIQYLRGEELEGTVGQQEEVINGYDSKQDSKTPQCGNIVSTSNLARPPFL
jgi:hypothetical protein